MDCSEKHKKRKPNGKPSGRKMVLEAGLEPAIGNPTSTSSWRVCQFHHPSTGCWTTARRLPKNRRSGKRKFARKTKPKENVLPKSILGARNGAVRLGRCEVRGGSEAAMPHAGYAGSKAAHRADGAAARDGRPGVCVLPACESGKVWSCPVAEGLSFPVYFTA